MGADGSLSHPYFRSFHRQLRGYLRAQRSADLVVAMCERLRAPARFRDLARLVALHHGKVHKIEEIRPKTLLKILEAVDAFRRPQRFAQFLLACEADFRGRLGFGARDYPQADFFRAVFEAARATDLSGLGEGGVLPSGIQQEVRRRRLRSIESVTRESYFP